MMEVVIASETSVSFYLTTRRNIPQDSTLQEIISKVSALLAFRTILTKSGHRLGGWGAQRGVLLLDCPDGCLFVRIKSNGLTI